MNNIISRNELLTSFDSLQDDFQKSLEQAHKQDENFQEILSLFQKNMKNNLNESLGKISKTNPLYQSISNFVTSLENTNKRWENIISKRDKGIGFRSGFNDSLLVFVYGKVKSGKSSLGNYVAWGNTDPNETLKNNVDKKLIPKYFSHEKTNVKNGDINKEAEINQEFRVGAIEATSSIQGFKLAGLTWVDSPGLHSVNEENGKLAKDYVEHADLILYTMKSDSPGRDSDLKEITELYQKGKKTLLLLTGSDETEEDEDDNGEIIQTLIMKDLERRQKQQQYIRGELSQIPQLANENIEIISFSARFAQLHQNDPIAFQDSGMGQLFSVMHQLIHADGVKLKQRTPLNNFKNFLEECQKDISPFSKLISDFSRDTDKVEKNFKNSLRNISYQAENKMRDGIHDIFNNIRGQSDEQKQDSLKTVQKQLEDLFNNILTSSLKELSNTVVNDFQSSISNTYQTSDLIKLPEFSLQTREETDYQVKAGNKRRNSGIGAAIGTGLGAVAGSFIPVVGTGLGAAAGGLLGGMIGGATGDDTDVEPISIKIVVGDNLQEIRQTALDSYPKEMSKYVEKHANEILGTALAVADTLSSNLENEIKLTNKSIENLLEDVNNKLKEY